MSIARRFTQFSQSEVSRLFSSARRIHRGVYWDILVSPRVHDYGRLLAIAPRLLGTSPERNLIRRRVKSVFFEKQAYDSAYDIVILLKKKALDLPFKDLESKLLGVFKLVQDYEKNTPENTR